MWLYIKSQVLAVQIKSMNFTQILTNVDRFKEFSTNMLSLRLGANFKSLWEFIF